MLVLAAAPRGGSTLTYQLLCEAFENVHLTNFNNLFYAAPFLSFLTSSRLTADFHSSFESRHGFVNGLFGEAEGLQFWRYWSGTGTRELDKRFNAARFEKLKKRLAKVARFTPESAFISGFLGHVFCLDELRKHSDRIIFVHLLRDFVENAESLARYQGERGEEVVSTTPQELEDTDGLSRHEKIAWQLYYIHKRILEQSNEQDTIRVNFETLKENPRQELTRIQDFANQKDMPLKWRDAEIPDSFPPKTQPNSNLRNEFESLRDKIEFDGLFRGNTFNH